MSDDEMQQVVKDLIEHEGCEPQMYLDTRGHVTVGIGEMLPTHAAAEAIPFVDAAGFPLAPAAIALEFDRVVSLGQFVPHPYAAAHYELRPPKCYLPVSVCVHRAEKRVLTESLQGLLVLLPNFDEYPLTVRRALVDMAWNLGIHGLGKFGNLLDCCKAGDWVTAATESHRRTCRDERNEWTKALFLAADGAVVA